VINKFISALRKVGIDPTPEEVADALWYAAQKPFPISTWEKDLQETQPLVQESDKSTESTTKSTEKTLIQEEYSNSLHGKSLTLYPSTGTKNNQTGGIPFCTPSGSALPGALKLTRMLRPLMRKMPSSHCVVDYEATVHQISQYQIANTNIWIPVQKPASIPWLEIALIVESSPSMHLWQQTVTELRLLLERQGAFRDVRVWKLDTSCPDQMNLSTGASSTKRNYRELINPAAPRVILVVTDCISPVWQGDKISHWLKAWGRTHPVAIVQMLPQQLWAQTQVSTAHLVHITAPYPGAPNKYLKRTTRSPWLARKLPTGIATPILTLEPDFMSAWAQLIANPTDTKKMPALILKSEAAAQESTTASKTATSIFSTAKNFITPFLKKTTSSPDKQPSIIRSEPTAAQRFAAFKANASPTTVKLACLLAAAPLRLPIMRLVQHTMLPESQQVHLAEFFLSGLLRRIDTDEDISDPDEMAYEFLSDDDFDIRGKLLDMGLVPDSIQVQRIVSSYIAEHYGQPNSFQAILENPELASELIVDPHNQAFANVSVEVLRRLGGDYAKAAKNLLLTLTKTNYNSIMGYKAFLLGVNTHGLQYSESDTELMSVCLAQHGYEIIKPYKKERHSILEQFEDMLDNCDKTDTVIFYFSGFALLSRAKLRLVLDNNPSKISNTIRISQITGPLEECRATNKLIILDCCHAGAATADLQLDLSDAYSILTASSRLEKSKEIDDFKAGFLTYTINQAVIHNIAEICVDQKITIYTLYDYLVKAAKEHNVKHDVQVPIPNLLGNAKNNFEVAGCESGIEPSNYESILELLESLTVTQFKKVLLLYNVPRTQIPPAGTFGEQTIALFEYALQKEGEELTQLLELIYKVAPHLRRGN
jgi:hypothetical protein